MDKKVSYSEIKTPLVSIMIPNFNHSRYLDQCISSALKQTYENIEIIVLDNNSTDNSIDVASKYLFDDRVAVYKNQYNIMNSNYRLLADYLINGDYMILLCADDYFISPNFIEYAVDIMEANPMVGYVHGEKEFVYDDGTIQHYDSFYRCSFIAPGLSTMPIYMITTVAHPSQGVIRRNAFISIGGYAMEIDHMNADRSLWFYLSHHWDVGYIKEKCVGIRIGTNTDTFIVQRNFQHPILCHLTIKDFVRYAKDNELEDVYNREEEALSRLANDFLVYAAGMLSIDDYGMARKYLDYAYIVDRSIFEDEKYKVLCGMADNKKKNMQILQNWMEIGVEKKRGYEPPKGYRELKI